MPLKDQAGAAELTIQPEDDGFHMGDYHIGDYEWWYFDLVDRRSGCFLKIVMHVGTDPLRTRIFPQLALSVNTPEGSESITKPYRAGELKADTGQCRISVGDEIMIRTLLTDPAAYLIRIDIPRFKGSFRFTGETEGWKPLGKEMWHRIGKKKGAFSWIIPMPKARVEGEFLFRGRNYLIKNAAGYHDHNYIRVDKRNPLHLDELVIKWYWGKCRLDRFTVVFMDTWLRTGRLLSLLVAEDNRIIYGANNRLECVVQSYGFDDILQAKYPASLYLRSTDEHFPFRADFSLEKISDHRDLLGGVHPFIKWIIKKLIAKPVYHGILATVKATIGDLGLEGYGNFESMVFREK